ncbi:DUF2334 domain-containing protein [Lachnospiraceae bacterium 54-53]
MNFNMMCKRLLICIVLFLLLSSGGGTATRASQKEQIPEGDILIIYNDGANEDIREMVSDMVELLTYQSFKVSYGPASLSMNAMDRFSHIICYDLTRYPEEFLKMLGQYENARAVGGREEAPHLLFVGNDCLKEYLDETGRTGEYEMTGSPVGEIQYTFDGLTYRTGLGKEDYFIFLNRSGYENGILTVNGKRGYVCAEDGRITHIPVTDIGDNLIRAVFIKEAARWKWPFQGDPNIFAQYMVINRVYPYEDPDKLLDVIKLLAADKTPFVISVMPVYVNGDYPAMVRFCEILRYAQANGGAVIINAPINQMDPFDKDIVLDYLEQALKIYNKHGVYPLALQVPRNWMFHQDTVEIMSHFKTIVTSEEKDPYIEFQDEMTNLVYKDGHQWVGTAAALDDPGTSSLSAYSSAVPISLSADMETIRKTVQACRSSSIPLKSLWDMEHSYWTDKILMIYKNQNLTLDGKTMNLSFVPSTYEEKYNYRRNMLQRFSRDLTSQNRKLIIMVGITSFLFLLFIFLARYANRRNYFFQNRKGREKDER